MTGINIVSHSTLNIVIYSTFRVNMNNIALILLCLSSVQCGNIVQKASSLGATTLVNLINHAGLNSTLANGGKPVLLYHLSVCCVTCMLDKE